MADWRAFATVVRDPVDVDELDALTRELPGFGIVVYDGRALRMEMTVSAATVLQAGADALREARRAQTAALGKAGTPVALRVLTLEEYDQETARPRPVELVGYTEIGQILRVSPERARQLAQRPDFPEPVACPAMGPIFTRASVEEFDQRWARRPGRPRKTPGPAAQT